ncbi:FIG01147061: hypothetical protein [hydrothermal vent metagenome]|uniref:YcxB-like protein domain-containing protein n=1 Tax=hydrothermal vent metagenome TaxID=652676 RepID=A0A1W1B8U4_9ZZZZ
MSKPIEIRYRWDRENLERVFDSSYRYQFENSRKRYVGWFFIALMQFGVVFALKDNSFGVLLFSTIILLYWYYGKRIIAKRRAIRAFESSEFKNRLIVMSVDDKYIHIEPKTKLKWSEIDEVRSIDDDIMLYKHPNFHYIPLSGFDSLEDISRFKSLARERGKLR